MSEQLAKWFVEFASTGAEKVSSDADKLRGKLDSAASSAQRSASTMSRFASAIATPFRAISNFAGMAQQKLQQLSQGMQKASQFARGLAFGVGGSIAGLVAAGLRDTKQAEELATAFKGLSKAVATLFLPVIRAVTTGVSLLSAAIGSLTSEQKSTVLTWLGWAAAITGVVLVLPKLIGFLTLAFGAVKFLTGALGFLIANPVVAGLLAIAAAIGYIAVKAKLAHDEIARLTKASREWEKNLTTGDINRSEVGQQMAKVGSPEEKLKIAKSALADYMRKQQALVNELKSLEKFNVITSAKDLWTSLSGGRTPGTVSKELLATERMVATAAAAVSKLEKDMRSTLGNALGGLIGPAALAPSMSKKFGIFPAKEGPAQEEPGKDGFAGRLRKFMGKMFDLMGKGGDFEMKAKQKPAALEGIQDTFDRMLKAASSPADDTNKMILEQQKKANETWAEMKKMWKEFMDDFALVGP